MAYVFALAMFMMVVATRRKLASLGQGGVALTFAKAPSAHAWTALGLALGVACLVCLSPAISEVSVGLAHNALPLWIFPFTGVFSWFVLSLVTNRW